MFECDLEDDNSLNKFIETLKNKCPDFIVHNIGGTLGFKSP